jgi:HD-like signal output (HDOD) protein
MLRAGGNTNLTRLLAHAQLPALPQSAVRLLELSQNPDHGPHEFAVPIEADPGLTSQVLRFVNSSYFGFRQEISSVKLAISLVGIRTIKNFSLWSAVFSVVPNPKCGPFNLRSLWQDSLRRGLFARSLGKMLKLQDAEDLFAIALLQDMAVPLLAKELPTEYHGLLTARQGGLNRLSDLEREQLGWTHGEAGAVLARSWRLPEGFASTIEQHAVVEELDADQIGPGLRIVSLSALLPSTCDPTWEDREAFLAGFQRIAKTEMRTAEEFLRDIDREFTDFAPFLKLAQPAKSLSAYLHRSEELRAESGEPEKLDRLALRV